MKIVRAGILPETKVYQATCNHCRCVMEFTQVEAKQISDRNEDMLQVNCPTCSYIIWVKK